MIGCIIQARTKSKRFYRKIYEDICGKNTLQWTLEGVTKSRLVDKIILAMPEYDEVEFNNRFIKGEFKDYTDDRFVTYFGDPDDLMGRYYNAALKYDIDIIVRVCADSPLIQGCVIDEMINYYISNNITGFLGNIKICENSYPAGVAIEIFPISMLKDAMCKTRDPIHREHITPFMYRPDTDYDIYKFENAYPNTVISNRFDNFSFDTQDDLKLIRKITKEYIKHFDLNKAIENVEDLK